MRNLILVSNVVYMLIFYLQINVKSNHSKYYSQPFIFEAMLYTKTNTFHKLFHKLLMFSQHLQQLSIELSHFVDNYSVMNHVTKQKINLNIQTYIEHIHISI